MGATRPASFFSAASRRVVFFSGLVTRRKKDAAFILQKRSILLNIRFMVVNAIWFSTKVKCCKGNTKTLHPSKKVYNLYTNICSLPVCLHVKESVCFYCHLTLFMRNKLIYRGFKSVR